METLKAIAARSSVRSFTAEQIPEEKLTTILSAGCAAPVSMNQYDHMHLTVLQDPALIAQLSGAVQKIMKTPNDPLYGAPAVVLLSAKEMPAPGLDYTSAGCIAQNMMLAAADMDLGSVIVWGTAFAVNNIPALKTALGIPEEFKTLFGIVLGNPTALPPVKELKVSLSVNRV